MSEVELDDHPHPLGMDEVGRAYETPNGTLVPISDRELDDQDGQGWRETRGAVAWAGAGQGLDRLEQRWAWRPALLLAAAFSVVFSAGGRSSSLTGGRAAGRQPRWAEAMS
ncbi:hypothetical protein [Actinacidiphila paucisporea]|uniref:hypothetical protein n=1 Tax=Actinacidiphila paucisporea TaxID=310782 RepID=UPI001F44E438|nr:hypothetical protein [Actinacidiphila paucisporea]